MALDRATRASIARVTSAADAPSLRPSRWAWAPLAAIAVALVIVLVVPLVTGARLQRLWRHQSAVSAPAITGVNDLEAAIGAEAAARSEAAERMSDRGDALASAARARAASTADLHLLDSLVRQQDAQAITLLAEARVAIRAWQAEEDLFAAGTAAGAARHGPAAGVVRTPRWLAVQGALARVQALDDELAERSRVELAEIARLERLNGMVPIALVPLALLALGAVGYTARRTRALSREAAAGRLAAEHALAARSALMRGVTHDLKNPLGAARGYVELLTDGVLGPLPAAHAKIVDRLSRLVSVTLATVSDLVELSRSDGGALSVERVVTEVVPLVDGVVDDHRATGAQRGIIVALDHAHDGGAHAALLTDPARVRQVLDNLLSNALKYTPSGGHVCVSVAQAEDQALGPVVTIAVRDDGPGIPPAVRERVFEEFYRVPTTSAAAAGTGLGLAIAQRVARLLDGDLRLDETPGGGSTFTLLLPDPR